MDGDKVCRLSALFEKAMAEQANMNEQFELQLLYEEFINDGRNNQQSKKQATVRQLRIAH